MCTRESLRCLSGLLKISAVGVMTDFVKLLCWFRDENSRYFGPSFTICSKSGVRKPRVSREMKGSCLQYGYKWSSGPCCERELVLVIIFKCGTLTSNCENTLNRQFVKFDFTVISSKSFSKMRRISASQFLPSCDLTRTLYSPGHLHELTFPDVDLHLAAVIRSLVTRYFILVSCT